MLSLKKASSAPALCDRSQLRGLVTNGLLPRNANVPSSGIPVAVPGLGFAVSSDFSELAGRRGLHDPAGQAREKSGQRQRTARNLRQSQNQGKWSQAFEFTGYRHERMATWLLKQQWRGNERLGRIGRGRRHQLKAWCYPAAPSPAKRGRGL